MEHTDQSCLYIPSACLWNLCSCSVVLRFDLIPTAMNRNILTYYFHLISG